MLGSTSGGSIGGGSTGGGSTGGEGGSTGGGSTGSSTPEDVYGVQWYTGTYGDFTEGQVELERIGNVNNHHSLPVQSKMKPCLLADDGTVNKYLSADGNWDGETLDGSAGQVMVEIPAFYIRFDEELMEGTTDIYRRAVLINETAFPDAIYVPKRYVGVYLASISSDNKLCSVPVSGASNANNKTIGAFRDLARNRNSGDTKWNIITYECYKSIFWLYMVEYANRNSQANVMPLNAVGYHQGGLGSPPIPYRNIHDLFQVLRQFVDGVMNIDTHIYLCDDPADYSTFFDTDGTDAQYIGDQYGSMGYSKRLLFRPKGEIFPAALGGSSTTYWCDNTYQNPGKNCVVVGGWSGDSTSAGLAYVDAYYTPSHANANIGSRLCFLAENE